MMHLPKLLTSQLVRVHMTAKNTAALLDELTELLLSAKPTVKGVALDKATIYDAVMAREAERPSGLGHGCALPHARIEGLDAPVACLATLTPGMAFDAADNEPVRIVCLLLAPLEDPAATLTVMAEIAGLMSSDTNRNAAEAADSPEALLAILEGLDPDAGRVLTARNIMRKPYYKVHPETPLTEVTRLLQTHLLEATSVVDHEDNIVGIVSCDLLFRYGLPEFFGKLKSVAFVKKFDPFENYFKALKSGIASDVMTQDYAAVSEDATLLEVIFELSVRRQPKVFVIRDGKLVGVIDRIAVLNRVLNY